MRGMTMGPTSKKILLAAVLAALAMAAGCASAPDAGSAAADFNDDPDRIICRTFQETGSRLKERVCKTAREWDREAEFSEDMKRSLQHSGIEPASGPTEGRPAG
jgi:hypothetical protein